MRNCPILRNLKKCLTLLQKFKIIKKWKAYYFFGIVTPHSNGLTNKEIGSGVSALFYLSPKP
jgi:hypothetical protein